VGNEGGGFPVQEVSDTDRTPPPGAHVMEASREKKRKRKVVSKIRVGSGTPEKNGGEGGGAPYIPGEQAEAGTGKGESRG